MAEETRKIYKDTRLKFTLDIQSVGFSMADDDFKVVIRNLKAEKTITKGEMLVNDDDEYIFTVDTQELGTGDYYITTYAYVPDTDFDDGIRTEVTKQLLCVVTS